MGCIFADAMNVQVHETTGTSPYELVFGQKPREVLFPSSKCYKPLFEEDLEDDGICFGEGGDDDDFHSRAVHGKKHQRDEKGEALPARNKKRRLQTSRCHIDVESQEECELAEEWEEEDIEYGQVQSSDELTDGEDVDGCAVLPRSFHKVCYLYTSYILYYLGCVCLNVLFKQSGVEMHGDKGEED